MRVFTFILAVDTAGFLAACGDAATCTRDTATVKATEVMTAKQTLAASNPEKLAEMTPRLTEIQAGLTAEGADLTATCKALDDIQAEIAAAAAPAE